MLNRRDAGRIENAMELADELSAPGSFLRFAQASSGSRRVADAAGLLRFDHTAALAVADSHDDVGDALAAGGFTVREAIPSVVVRDRLAHRHSVPRGSLDVQIVRGVRSTAAGDHCGVEVFSIERASARSVSAELADDRRATDEEAHVAYRMAAASVGELEAVRKVCRDELALTPDDAGYNPHEDIDSGGRTVLYFAADRVQLQPGLPLRLELFSAGHFGDVIAVHNEDSTGDEHMSLLSILAGHWSARAVHFAATSGIADHLSHESLTAAEVASLVGTDTDATTRVLQYLAHLGFVRRVGPERYTTTASGALLRGDNAFGDLARLYGGEFYEAWGDFEAAVRTGGTGFRHRFGKEHFDYFSEHETTARIFDRSMQAVTHLVADALPTVFDFPAGSTVIDIGGGNGTLLQRILRRNPQVHGVVFDRSHVVGGVEPGGFAEPRLSSQAGDFFEGVPAEGDVYLLSRVLHDWGDEDCMRILRACRAACTPGRQLLLLERLLPDDVGKTSLAAEWDMQMLTVTGGRERRRHEYEQLLEAAGFHLADVRPLPLEMNLLIAKPK